MSNYAFHWLIMWKDFLTPEEVLAGNAKRKDFEDKRKQAAEKVTGLPFLAIYFCTVSTLPQRRHNH